VESIFSQADLTSSGSIPTRSKLREAMTPNIPELKNIIGKQPVYQQVLRKLESISTVQIPINDVEDAIAEVAEDNGNLISETKTSDLANMILKSANADKAGAIDRVQLKEAIIANQAKMNEIIEESLPQANPVVDPVMSALDTTNDGILKKVAFKYALINFND